VPASHRIVSKVWQEIRKGPDGVLVAVDGPRERVRISKEGNYLHIEVDEGGDHVRERLTVHELENDAQGALGVLEAVHRGDVGMVERGEQFRLTLEPRRPIGIL